jgi:hypothetical protein
MQYNKRPIGLKAQVTLFVIIGLVILIVIGAALYVISIKKTPTQPSENIPAELQPFKNQVEQCLLQTAKEGFIVAGQHGGYVNPEQFGILPIEGRETSTAGIYFAPGSNITIPYWYYMSTSDTCKTCEFRSKRPAMLKSPGIPSIESEVASYINEHIKSCIDYTEFEKRGYSFNMLKNPSATVLIGKENIKLLLTYPYEIKKGSTISRVSIFDQTLNFNFKRIYDVATTITQEWEASNFKALEQTSIQLINGYGLEGSAYDLPPVSGPTTFTVSSPKTWTIQNVKKDMKSILSQNVPFVQVYGSNGYSIYRSENQFSKAFYNSLIFPLKNIDQTSLNKVSADFSYLPWWDIYLKINPSKGGLIMPDAPFTLNLIFFTFSMQNYNFHYDLSYPVVVTLKDPDAFNKEGYTFQFALEVNVRNTMPMNTSLFNLSRVEGVDESLFSHENQKVAGITVKTRNALTKDPLDEVLVMYSCAEDSMVVGQTLLSNNEAVLSAKIPPCQGGWIETKLDNYTSDPVSLSIVENQTSSLFIDMYPIVKKKVEVKKRMIAKEVVQRGLIALPTWVYKNTSEEDIGLDEQVLLVIQRNSNFDENFMRVINFFGNESDNQTIELTPGEYTVEGFVMRNFGENYSMDKFVIPAARRCEGGGLFSSETCYDIPAIEFNDSFYVGGITLDNSTTGFFNITVDDLKKNTLTLYMIGIKLDDVTQAEDLEQLDNIDNFAIAFPDTVKPAFS